MTRLGVAPPGWLARVNLSGWLVVLGVVAAWQLLTMSGASTLDNLPAPTEVLAAASAEISEGTMLAATSETLRTAALASIFAAGIGIALGTAIGLLEPVRVLAGATVDFLRNVPAVSLMPVVLLLYGARGASEVLVGVFAGVWPILLSTVGGVSQINPRLHEVGRVLQLGRVERVRKIFVPAAVPAILVGLRLGVVTTLVVVVIAEMLINPAGIGWQLIVAQQALRPDVLFAYAVLTGLLGYSVNAALVVAARQCLPGSQALRSAS